MPAPKSPAHLPDDAKGIARALPGPWRLQTSGAAYPTPQTRINVDVYVNETGADLQFLERDPAASNRAFASDFMLATGLVLTPSHEAFLVETLVQSLSEWQTSHPHGPRSADFTGDLLRRLLTAHEARCVARMSRPPERQN